MCEVVLIVLKSKHNQGKEDWVPSHVSIQNIDIIYFCHSFLSILQSLGDSCVGRQWHLVASVA